MEGELAVGSEGSELVGRGKPANEHGKEQCLPGLEYGSMDERHNPQRATIIRKNEDLKTKSTKPQLLSFMMALQLEVF